MGARENRRRERWGGGGWGGIRVIIFSHASLCTIFFSYFSCAWTPFFLNWTIYYYQLSFSSFQFSVLRPDHFPQTDLQSRSPHQTNTPQQSTRSAPDQTTKSEYQTSTTPDHPQTQQPSGHQTVTTIPDHQIRPSPPYQTTRSDHPNRQPSLTSRHQISTAVQVSLNGTG